MIKAIILIFLWLVFSRLSKTNGHEFEAILEKLERVEKRVAFHDKWFLDQERAHENYSDHQKRIEGGIESILQLQHTQEQQMKQMLQKYDQLEQTIWLQWQQLQFKELLEQKLNLQDAQLKQLHQQQTDQKHTLLEELLKQLKEENQQRMEKLQQQITKLAKLSFIQSCRAATSKTSGIFRIQTTPHEDPFTGYCVMDKFEGGWLVIQQRQDGSVDFYRNWTDYRNGFGTPGSEYWMGLELIHKITVTRPHELIVELINQRGVKKFARYDAFEIGSEGSKYELQKVGLYSGTAGDSMITQKGRKFSTVDNDNDNWDTSNCAEEKYAAWWFREQEYCSKGNLNGRYKGTTQNTQRIYDGNYWLTFDGIYGMQYSRMMIRERYDLTAV